MKNLTKLYERADKSGANWYREAHEFCQKVADKYALPLVTVCAVVSALSPATNWEQNKADAIALIRGDKNYKPTTYGQNVAKARQILRDGIPRFNPKTGAKTYNFFHAILEPDNSAFCVIDRHAYAIATAEIYGGITPKKYNDVKNHYVRTAKRLGLTPNELQATLWVQYRKEMDINFAVKVPF